MRSTLTKVIPWIIALLGALTVVLAVLLGTELGTWVDEHSSQAVTDTFPNALPILALGTIGVIVTVLGIIGGALTLTMQPRQRQSTSSPARAV